MVFLLVPVVAVVIIIAGKIYLRKWLNHITLYCVSWSGLILLYELKLLPYPNIVPLAWFYIISAFISFVLGTITVQAARNLSSKKQILSKKSDALLTLFLDNGRTVKYALIFFSVVAILAAIQHWLVLINMFGSIPGVFLNANKIYSLSGHGGGIKGQVPFFSNFGYVAVFFSGIYAAYKGRFSLLTFLPFIGIVIKELSAIGRAGMLLALLEFLFVFFLFRHLLNDDHLQRFKFSKRNAVISFTVLIVFFVASASFVRLARIPGENFSGQSRQLKSLKENAIINPTLYLYLSSTVGVLSKYIESGGENTKFGRNTFLTVYHILARFDAVERGSDYQQGYYIPMWTNTGTYIRELDADFGVTGALLGPYLLGLLITWLWFKFYEKRSLIVLTILVYLYLIIGFSFLVIITRTSYWSISQALIILTIPFLEKIVNFTHKKTSSKLLT